MDQAYTLLDYFVLLLPTFVAIGAVAYSARTLKEFKKSQQFNMVNTVLGDINKLEGEIPTIYQMQVEKENNELTDVYLNQLLSRIFNKVDWLSYLVNSKQIRDKSLKGYIIPVIRDVYDGTYTKYATNLFKKDSEFKEFKKLYQDYKNCKYD